jgi:hypothetical protein
MGTSPAATERALLQAQLAQAFFPRVQRVLVVKALPDDEFSQILSALQQALPGAAITCLVSGDAAGPEDEVGAVLRGRQGLLALRKKSRPRFDLCLLTLSPNKAGGYRRFVADLAALFSGAKEKVLCSPQGFFGRSRRTSIILAPFISGIKLAAAIIVSTLCTAISLLLFTLIVLPGGGLARLFSRRRKS